MRHMSALLRRYLIGFIAAYLALLSQLSMAQAQFLAQDQAFVFEARSISADQIELSWKVADDYYLYQHQFAVTANDVAISFELPPSTPKHDEYYGDTKVYEQNIQFTIPSQPDRHYQVTYQGCAEKGLCYPITKTEFKTDQDGLVLFAEPTAPLQKNLFDSVVSDDTVEQVDRAPITDGSGAQDQKWSSQLHEQSFAWSIVVFLGLGILLAFTPCSLPMLPILSSLLIRNQSGLKAGVISSVFVLSMASVYAILGLIAASAGSNFQRWLQQPSLLIGFSLLFLLFAANLFGAFDLKIPQKWSNRLDQLQSKQKGGTILGAAVMGMLSALLVGPCMTAPLAGTLLYISQTEQVWLGAGLLFSLGLGMGIPLILLTLIGQKAVPKPGPWMNDVRSLFGFVMLGLSIYFVRPLLSETVFNLFLLLVIIVFVIYLTRMLWLRTGYVRFVALIGLILIIPFTLWKSISYWQTLQYQKIEWNVVTNQQEFDQALRVAQQKQQPIVIDLYADWCIACQPIEREIWAHPDTHQALENVSKIKLDLSRYDTTQQTLLSQWELLGPPTVIFLDSSGREYREQRLTGTFKHQVLLEHIAAIKN